MEKGRYDLEERLVQFAAQIIGLIDALPTNRTGNHVASQLLRSATSPMANHAEARSAESHADFVHKLKICLKELRESFRWLRLVQKVRLVQSEEVEKALQETDELVRIFVKSIQTVEAKGKDGKREEGKGKREP
jgi:four helix bundle protein